MFADIAEYFHAGDCLVLNRTRVVPARVFGRKETGGKVEVLFLTVTEDPASGRKVKALVKPFLPEGKKIILPGGMTAVIEGKTQQGETVLELSGPSLHEVLQQHGQMPLPPYIKRNLPDSERFTSLDRDRYQTVYALHNGSIAAPTAGLHFTQEIIGKIKEKGVEVSEVVLHVGWGTFRPVLKEDIPEHSMLPEYYEIPPETINKINEAAARKGRVIAVGTTSVRSLESAWQKETPPAGAPACGETSLFIYPGYTFRIVNTLVTNFHVPRSTPLLMACAFAGREHIFSAYLQAIEKKYRFFSYGDAMLII